MLARHLLPALLVGVFAVAPHADAQDLESEPEPVVPAVTDPPGEAPALTYDEYKLQEIRRRARVSRNALIGTSVAAAVGIALFLPGVITQCDDIRRPDGTTEINCSTGGALMLGFGTPLMFGGGVGAIVTGIMLGVRKRKVRQLKQRLGTPSARRVQWDPARGQWVF